MAKNKTVETENDVSEFVKSIPDKEQRMDCITLVEIIQKQTKLEPKLWGTSIIGYGSYHYKYESGREGNAPIVGFAPRKNNFALYLGTFDKRKELLSKLGKHKEGKGCININKLSDVNIEVLKEMIDSSVKRK